MENRSGNFIVPRNMSFVDRHQPEILLSAGLAGLITSTILCGYATAKVVKLCEQKRLNEDKDKLTFKEKIKIAWRHYIPVVLSAGIGIACTITSNRVSSRRAAMLAAAYALSETTLQSFQAKTQELIGEKKTKQIKEEVAKEQIAQSNNNKEIIINDDSEQTFFEPLSGRYFKGTWNKIQAACNELNENALGSTTGIYTENDWFEKLGIGTTGSGEKLGWGVPSVPGSKGLMKISLGTYITPENKVCGMIQYDVESYPLY